MLRIPLCDKFRKWFKQRIWSFWEIHWIVVYHLMGQGSRLGRSTRPERFDSPRGSRLSYMPIVHVIAHKKWNYIVYFHVYIYIHTCSDLYMPGQYQLNS